MQKIVVFGKGGIGKSTVVANLAVVYARQGKKVLLLGCDPKHDSSLLLTHGRPIPTVAESDIFRKGGDPAKIEELIVEGRQGIDCIEAGGPEPGVGCAGRGISRMLELFGSSGVMRAKKYDVLLFDVLGDVVCGGFAAPLREGFADKVCIVVSDEMLALYAANNIARAMNIYAANGIALAGLIANTRAPLGNARILEHFARRLNTRVLSYLHHDPLVAAAQKKGLSVVEHAPEALISRRLTELAKKIYAFPRARPVMPTPLSNADFCVLSPHGFYIERAAGESPSVCQGSRASGCDRLSRETGEAHEEAAVPGIPKPGGPQESPRVIHRIVADVSWPKEQAWRHFFCFDDSRNDVSSSIRLDNARRIFFLDHGDRECKFSHVQDGGNVPSLINHSWLPLFSSFAAREHLKHFIGGNLTDLKHPDVVLGTAGKLRSALRGVIDASSCQDTSAIVVTSLCTPTVMGDDVEALVKDCRKKTKRPLIYLNPRTRGDSDFIEEIFRSVLSSGPLSARKRKPAAVNLLDFSESYRAEELLPLLEKLGIRVNMCVFPEVDMARIKDFAKADAQVFFGDSPRGETIRSYFARLPMKNIVVQPPFGRAGAKQCVRDIATFFGKTDVFRRVWRDFERGWAAQWEGLAGKARDCRLAFVVDGDSLFKLDDPASWGGYSALRFLWDLGFSFDLLVFSADQKAAAFMRSLARKLRIKTMRHFRSPDELRHGLKAGRFDAVYSDFFCDWRLTEAGKAQFSSRYFEMGLLGGLRTMERLLGVRDLSFYKRYGRYLSYPSRRRDA